MTCEIKSIYIYIYNVRSITYSIGYIDFSAVMLLLFRLTIFSYM